MLDLNESANQDKVTAPTQWRINLAQGLLNPPSPRFEGLRMHSLRQQFSEAGLPTLELIPVSSDLSKDHPLRLYIDKPDPLGVADLQALLRHPAIDLSVVGFHTGAIAAAVHNQLFSASRQGLEDYSRNMWARDGIITATALNRAGRPEEAHRVVRALWAKLGGNGDRSKILQYHFGGPEHGRKLFIEKNEGPHIKFSVRHDGSLDSCDHDWGHQQLDALGAAVWAPYRFANQRGGAWAVGGALDLRGIDPDPRATDSILPASIKMLRGVKAHDTLDYGPWEDIRQWRRATSVGIVLAALHEARMYHDREGWDVLPVEYEGRQDGARFREELEETLYNCLRTVQARIPEAGIAVECDRRPCDSALVFLLYPFDCNLNVARQNTILRTVYQNMGDVGFTRWQRDSDDGPDTYVGQDYFHNTDPKLKGEFAKLVDGFRPAQWTLFDPLLAAYYFRRFIESDGKEHEAFLYGDRHLKRCLSFITSAPHNLHVAGKDAIYRIPAGILPEAFAWDSRSGAWRPNHNSPLLMAQAALALAFERALEACRMRDNLILAENSARSCG